MPNETNESSVREQRVNEVIAAYLEAMDAGEAPDPKEFIAAHSDISEELNSFFANRDDFERMAEPLQPAGDAALRPQADDPTLPPTGEPTEAPTLAPTETAGAAIGTMVRYFGDYELLDEIARGGMGVVYKARQASLNRIVALKMILAGQLAGEEDVQRFHAEAEAAANLDHPGIVPIYEVGEHEGQHYFSMGFVEGNSLSAKVADGPLPPREAAEYTKKVAEAVAFAHEKGVIHRDLKPANVLLDANDQPKVTDFGLAKKVEGDEGLTATGQILGTPGYMPPEQASGKIDEVTETADVYSLGAILYCLLTARPPFQADNPLDTLMQVLEQEPVSPRTLNPKIPQDLETVCLKCMEKDRRGRYGSALAFAEDLRRFLNGEPVVARPISRTRRVLRWCRRKPLAATFIGVTAVLLTVILLVNWVSLQRTAVERERSLYVADIQNAQAAWETGQIDRMNHSLNWYFPTEGRRCRNWEWYYLQSVGRQDQLTLHLKGGSRSGGAACWSPDGQRLVTTGSTEGTVWDAETGEPLFHIRNEDPHSPKKLKPIAWSGDGRCLVGLSESTVTLWNAYTGDEIGRLGEGKATAVSSGRRVAISNGRQVELWDVHTRQEVGTIAADGVTAMCWSRSGERLALADRHSMLKVWDAHKLALDAELQSLHSSQVETLAWSPDEKLVATGGADGLVHIWDVAKEQMVAVLSGPQAKVSSLAWSPDGKRLAAASHDHSIRVWDFERRRKIANIRGHSREVLSIDWSPDGLRLLSAGADGTAKVWDAVDLPQDSLSFPGWACAWSPDGSTLALAIEEMTGNTKTPIIDLWDPTSRKSTLRIEEHGYSGIFHLAYSADGRRLASLGTTSTRSRERSEPLIKVWDVTTGEEKLRCNVDAKIHNITEVSLSPDGVFMAGRYCDRWDVWRLETGGQLPQPPEDVDTWSRSHEDRIVEMGGSGETVELKDSRSGAVLLTLLQRVGSFNLRRAAWSPDGKRLALRNVAIGRIHVWDASTGFEIEPIEDLYWRPSYGGHTAPAGLMYDEQVPLLAHRDPVVRRLARRILFEHGQETAQYLLRRFADQQDASMRAKLAECFIYVRAGGQAAGSLRSMLDDPAPRVRLPAAAALLDVDIKEVGLGEAAVHRQRAIRELADLLSENVEVAVRAARLLRFNASGDDQVAPALRQALEHDNLSVRVEAAAALWRFQPETELVVPVLVEGLTKGDTPVRRAAIETFRAVRPEAATVAIAHALNDSDFAVRWHAKQHQVERAAP